MPTIEEFLEDAKRRMDRSIETTRTEFNSVRTGRASAALLGPITIDYYGHPDAAQEHGHDRRPRAAHDHRAAVRPEPDQGDREGGPGIRPRPDPVERRQAIRLLIPQLTEERRKELVKLVRKYGEEGKVAIRNAAT